MKIVCPINKQNIAEFVVVVHLPMHLHGFLSTI